MAKESLYGVGNEPMFKETFNSEFSVRTKTNDIGSNIVFSNGKAISSDSANSYIDYPFNKNSTISIRIKINSTSFINAQYFVDFRQNGGIGYVYAAITTGIVNASSGTIYVDGQASTSLTLNTDHEVIISGISINSSFLCALARNDHITSNSLNGSFELLELYEGTLTAEEIKNMYNGVRYRDIQPESTTHKEILNIDSRKGTIYDKYGNTITNTDVEIVIDGEIYVQKYNGSSSFLQLGNISNVSTIEFWVKPNEEIDGVSSIVFLNFDASSNVIWLGASGNILKLTASGIQIDTTLSSLNAGWHHVVYAIAGAGSKCYVNGVDVTSSIIGTATSIDFTDFEIGRRNNMTFYLNMSVGKIRLYEGIITGEEASQLHTSTKQFYSD